MNVTNRNLIFAIYLIITTILTIASIINIVIYYNMKNKCWLIWEMIVYETVCNIISIAYSCRFINYIKKIKNNEKHFYDSYKCDYYFSRFVIFINITGYIWIMIAYFMSNANCDKFWMETAMSMYVLFVTHFIITWILFLSFIGSICINYIYAPLKI